MKIAVVGATGTIGAAVARRLNEEGHEVVPVTRNSATPLDLDDPASIDAFYDAVGELDGVVCVAGNAAFGPVDQVSDEQVRLGVESKLMGQINLVRKGLSRVNRDGLFVLTGGMLAYQPWPGSATVAMLNSAVEGFVRAAALDLSERQRILVVHPPLVSETAAKMGLDPSPWPTAEAVADAYGKAVAGDASGVPLFVDGFAPA